MKSSSTWLDLKMTRALPFPPRLDIPDKPPFTLENQKESKRKSLNDVECNTEKGEQRNAHIEHIKHIYTSMLLADSLV